ncbi:hypothetical protein RB213_004466 [Colletotrichum asianum]
MTLRRNFGSLGPLVDKTRQTYNYTLGKKNQATVFRQGEPFDETTTRGKSFGIQAG